MQARGALMIEHRLIERMIGLIDKVVAESDERQEVDPDFVDTAVDFIRVYADRTHHGKEEEILFRDLKEKNLSPEDEKLMEQLIEEHVFGRQTTKALEEANERFREGDKKAFGDVVDKLRILTDFYPKHVEKEDRTFFPASTEYFTKEEDQAMQEEFREFDRKMIHEKYGAVVEALEKQKP